MQDLLKNINCSVVQGDISRIESDALITAINSGGMWFGGIDGVIQRSANNMFHSQATSQMPLEDCQSVVAMQNSTHNGAFKNVVFVVDDKENQKKLIEELAVYKSASKYVYKALKYVDDKENQALLIKELANYSKASKYVAKAFIYVDDEENQLLLAKDLKNYRSGTQNYILDALKFSKHEKVRKILIEDFLSFKKIDNKTLINSFEAIYESKYQKKIIKRLGKKYLSSLIKSLENISSDEVKENIIDSVLLKKQSFSSLENILSYCNNVDEDLLVRVSDCILTNLSREDIIKLLNSIDNSLSLKLKDKLIDVISLNISNIWVSQNNNIELLERLNSKKAKAEEKIDKSESLYEIGKDLRLKNEKLSNIKIELSDAINEYSEYLDLYDKKTINLSFKRLFKFWRLSYSETKEILWEEIRKKIKLWKNIKDIKYEREKLRIDILMAESNYELLYKKLNELKKIEIEIESILSDNIKLENNLENLQNINSELLNSNDNDSLL